MECKEQMYMQMQLFRLHVMIYNPFLLVLHYYYFTMQARGGEVHVPSRVSEEKSHAYLCKKMSFGILIKQGFFY